MKKLILLFLITFSFCQKDDNDIRALNGKYTNNTRLLFLRKREYDIENDLLKFYKERINIIKDSLNLDKKINDTKNQYSKELNELINELYNTNDPNKKIIIENEIKSLKKKYLEDINYYDEMKNELKQKLKQ